MMLGDIADIVMGVSPSGDKVNRVGDGLPLLNGPTEFGSYHPEPVQYCEQPIKTAALGHLLFCVRGSTTGRMNWADQEYAIGRGIAAISHKTDQRLNSFLRGVVESALPELLQGATGSTFPNVSRTALASIPVPICGVIEQRRIAHILGTLDDKIELNRQMNKTLDEIARTLFRSWFVDFEPVRAKMEGRQPEGMDAATAALFPDRLVESELGLIPEGWEWRKLEDVAAVNGSSLRSTDKWQEIQYIDISSVREGDISELTTYLQGEEPSRAKRKLRHGDTALSTVRPDRRSYFLALHPDSGLIASTGFAVITPKSIPWSVLHSALTQDSVFEKLGTLADGGAYPAIRSSVIGDLDIVYPHVTELLERYHAMAEPIYELAHSNRIESKSLAELRDTLLPELLAGREFASLAVLS